MKSGKEIIFYDNGNVKHSGTFKEGEMHGLWKFYRRDGSLMRAGKFALGSQVGIWITYARDGSRVKETNFDKK